MQSQRDVNTYAAYDIPLKWATAHAPNAFHNPADKYGSAQKAAIGTVYGLNTGFHFHERLGLQTIFWEEMRLPGMSSGLKSLGFKPKL